MLRRNRPFIPAVLWSILIASSCLLPRSAFPVFHFNQLFQFDKLVHFILFWFFIVFWLLAIDSRQPINHKTKWIALLISIAYGVLIEYIQLAMAVGRSLESGDIIANSIGALIGLLMLPKAKKWVISLGKHLPFVNRMYQPNE